MGDINVKGSVGGPITTGKVQGNISSYVGGNVSAIINELPESGESGKPGIKELLSQLKSAIDDSTLDEDDKSQALEQVKVLAEVGQKPNDENVKKQAKKAIGFLGVIAEGLPSAAKLVDACKSLLPVIKVWFGLL